jgi:hypothetical protein
MLDLRSGIFFVISGLYCENISFGDFFFSSVNGSAHATRLSGDFNLCGGKLDRDSATVAGL